MVHVQKEKENRVGRAKGITPSKSIQLSTSICRRRFQRSRSPPEPIISRGIAANYSAIMSTLPIAHIIYHCSPPTTFKNFSLTTLHAPGLRMPLCCECLATPDHSRKEYLTRRNQPDFSPCVDADVMATVLATDGHIDARSDLVTRTRHR